MSGLQNKVVLITGGGRGIGAACARHFAEAGAKVAISSRSRDELEEVAAQIKEAGHGEALVCVADMASPEDISTLFKDVKSSLGPVDVLISCAAMIDPCPMESVTLEAFDRLMAVNVRSVFLCCQEAFAQMKGRGGSIVTFSSLGGIRSTEKFPGLSTYVTSKFAVVGLTESLAVEGKPHGIRVNCVAPGAVDTVMLRTAAPHLKTSTTPDDIAPICLFLGDETQSKSVTGSTLEVFSNG